MTFWNASRSPPPQLAMTVMVRFAALVAVADAVGVPEPCGVPVCWQAVATSAMTTSAIGTSETLRRWRAVIRSLLRRDPAGVCRSRADPLGEDDRVPPGADPPRVA